MSRVPEPVEGAMRLGRQLSQHDLRLGRVAFHQVARETGLDRHRDELLLGAVVEVALDPATLGVGRSDDACSRLPQLLGPARQLLERRPQLRIELGVAEREADLPSELVQDILVLAAERLAAGRTLHDDQTEELTRLDDWSHTKLGLIASVEDLRQPDADPGGARDSAARQKASLGLAEPQRGRTAFGIGGAAFEGPFRACPQLDGIERQPVSQGLGKVEQDLVDRHRPGQLARQGAKLLARRGPVTVR